MSKTRHSQTWSQSWTAHPALNLGRRWQPCSRPARSMARALFAAGCPSALPPRPLLPQMTPQRCIQLLLAPIDQPIQACRPPCVPQNSQGRVGVAEVPANQVQAEIMPLLAPAVVDGVEPTLAAKSLADEVSQPYLPASAVRCSTQEPVQQQANQYWASHCWLLAEAWLARFADQLDAG